MHIEACEKSGLSIRAYADTQGLPVGSLYNARHRLNAIGAWSPTKADEPRPESSVTPAPTARFQRVVVRSESEADEKTSPFPASIEGRQVNA